MRTQSVLIASAWLSLLAAPAGGQELLCGERAAVPCFMSKAKVARIQCESRNRTFAMEADFWKLDQKKAAMPRYVALGDCSRDAQKDLKPYLDAARQSKPDLAVPLTEYLAELLVALRDGEPSPSESSAKQGRRAAEHGKTLDRLEKKIELAQ